MPTQITSAGVTFNDTTSLTSANGVPSALKLTTARTINGVAFDGTANITVPASGTSAAKAWVNFDGTLASPTPVGRSYNVSSVTKSGTGIYTINFSSAMTDANYAIAGGAWNTGGYHNSVTGSTKTTTQCSVDIHWRSGTTSASGYVDSPQTSVIIFGN